MARVKFGDGVSGQTGSLNKQLGGVTYLKNGVKRMRVIPTNPRSTPQTTVRAVFSFLTSQWAILTEAQREAWNTAKELAYYFVPNDFYGGTRAATSGKSLFILVNYNLNEAFETLGAPAVNTTDPSGPEPSDELGVTSFVFDASANTGVLTYTGTLNYETLIARVTPPVSAGNMRLTSVESKLRSALAIGTASPATITKPDGVSFSGATGEKVFWVVEAINNTSGKKRILATGSSVIVA
jgi:hypothetical protein